MNEYVAIDKIAPTTYAAVRLYYARQRDAIKLPRSKTDAHLVGRTPDSARLRDIDLRPSSSTCYKLRMAWLE